MKQLSNTTARETALHLSSRVETIGQLVVGDF